jgi:poly[(R)-3-hydroxyalkanoate] polymerase subunit PhaC
MSNCSFEVSPALAAGGHNAGIISPPGHPRRNYQVATRSHGTRYMDPDTWLATAPRYEGSWWPAWQAWLARSETMSPRPRPIQLLGAHRER